MWEKELDYLTDEEIVRINSLPVNSEPVSELYGAMSIALQVFKKSFTTCPDKVLSGYSREWSKGYAKANLGNVVEEIEILMENIRNLQQDESKETK